MENERHASKDFPERMVIFIDFHNLENSLRSEGLQIDICTLMDYLAEGRWLLEAFVYLGFNPDNFKEDQSFHRSLKMNGFMVRTKPAKIRPDGSLKCDLDIELVLDVIDYDIQVKPDIVLLVTGDGDFAPLASWLRRRGVRVEVASTPNSLSQNLKEEANGYIDLCEACEEIQKVGMGIPPQREEVMTNGDGNNQWKEGADPRYVI